MKKIILAAMSTAIIATCYIGDFAEAQQPLQQIGYVEGSWLTSCSGEPLREGRCKATDRHVRCWQTLNPNTKKVKCNIAMKANMYNEDEGFKRSYTVGLQTILFATDSDWLCFNYDELLEGGPVAWTVEDISEPVVSCAAGNDEPPCTTQQLIKSQQGSDSQCPGKTIPVLCDSPFPDSCRL